VTDPEHSELLPSIVQILRRAGALERVPAGEIQGVSRLPVFQGRGWKRAIIEFLRWSGSTPDPWGSTSVFELLLCHGASGARALFEAYRHDRLERGASFEEAEAQLEAVRTVVSMAAYWLHVIEWDLRDAPRLSLEEYRSRRRGSREGVPREPIDRVWAEEPDPSRRVRPSSSVNPVFPNESAAQSLWKNVSEKAEIPVAPVPPRPRSRDRWGQS
jgi:hypothetical protein